MTLGLLGGGEDDEHNGVSFEKLTQSFAMCDIFFYMKENHLTDCVISVWFQVNRY